MNLDLRKIVSIISTSADADADAMHLHLQVWFFVAESSLDSLYLILALAF
jgi:hypothetical protein